MQIKIDKLILENFKGIKSFELVPAGQSHVIRGVNAAGKTTIADGFMWLLFGKDSQGKSDFAIKTLDQEGREIHNLNHAVEGILNIDEQLITLRKVFAEKWTKKRGSAKRTFTGHTTNHFIDGIPIQQKEWDNRIQSIIEEDTFKLLTSPTYFNALHWTKRREILLQVCGDISDNDVIDSSKEITELPEILNGRSLEEHRKVITAKKKEINDRLREIPARIDELTKSLSDEKINREQIQSNIEQLGKEIERLKDNAYLADLRKAIAEKQAEFAEAKVKQDKPLRKANQEINKKIEATEKEIRNLKTEIGDGHDTIKKSKKIIDANETLMSDLRTKYTEIQAQEPQKDTTCPTCKQSLPQDQIEAATSRFNKGQADKLAKINLEGKSLKKENEKLKILIEKTNKKIADLSIQVETHEKEIVQLNDDRPRDNPLQSKVINALQIEIQALEKELNTQPNNKEKIENLTENRRQAMESLAAIDAADKSKNRIVELKVEEKKLATEYEGLEHQTFIMERFVVAKVEMLEEKINSRFDLARFKLFETQINEGIKETCVTLYDGVPYGSGLNTGAEINVGLDIVKTLSDYYGIKAPIFIDHAESVIEILDPGTQTIKLAVDKTAKELEVSYE